MDQLLTTKRSLKYSLIFLKFCGGFGKTTFQNLRFFILMLNCYVIYCIPQVIYAYFTPDLDHAIQSLAYPVLFVSMIIKTTYFFINRNGILELIEEIDEENLAISSIHRQKRIEISNRTLGFTLNFIRKYIYFNTFGVVVTYIDGLINNHLIHDAEFGINMVNTNPAFWLVSTYSAFSTFCSMTTNISFNAFVALTSAGITMRIQLLKFYLTGIGKRNSEVHKYGIKIDRFDRKYIQTACKMYIDIFRLAKRSESVFGNLLFVQILASCGILCGCLFQIAGLSSSNALDLFINGVGFILVMVMELFMNIIFISQFLNESSTILLSVGASEWYNLSLKNRTQLIYLQGAIQQTLSFKCVGWLPLNFSLFTDIIQLSYKGFLGLKNLINAN